MRDKNVEERRYEGLSPFELKNKLIAMTQEHHERMMLNAGRGNPNWLAESSRQGYFQFGFFALSESKRVWHQPGFNASPEKDGVGARFDAFLADNKDQPGVDFLRDTFALARGTLGLDIDDGVVRTSLVHYTSEEEVSRLIKTLDQLL